MVFIWGLAICLGLLFDEQNDVGEHGPDKTNISKFKGISLTYVLAVMPPLTFILLATVSGEPSSTADQAAAHESAVHPPS